jgi:hypothetical protein
MTPYSTSVKKKGLPFALTKETQDPSGYTLKKGPQNVRRITRTISDQNGELNNQCLFLENNGFLSVNLK